MRSLPLLALLLVACGGGESREELFGPDGTGGSTIAFGGAGGTGGAGATTGTGGVPSGAGGVIGVGAQGGAPPAANCSNELPAVIRDFTEAHSDFESYLGSGTPGMVLPDLGPDQKPVYAHPGPTATSSGPAQFAHWYNDDPMFNISLGTTIVFQEPTPGTFLYDNSAFFPIDNQGFGNGPNSLFMMSAHNYLFTTEIHTEFTYEGGELFTFRGDDDLWVFINRKLAIDLGGVHGALEQSIDMDNMAPMLGISIGNTYPMDIFHAERHTVESNFRIETTIKCFTPVDVR